MRYVTAASDMVDGIYNVLHTAIQTIYPQYYPKEVVEFFCKHHSKGHILEGIAKMHDTVILDASLPAVCLYWHRGYKTVGHGIYELEHNVKLVYDIMEKKLGTDGTRRSSRDIGT